MNKVSAWFERKFSFDFPAELYPNLIVRLRGTPARLEEMLRGLSREQLVRQPGGKWSIQENAGHLLDLEPLWFARVDDFFAAKEILAPADLTNRQTHEARHNERRIEELLAAFRRARLALVERVETLAAEDFTRTALHPRLRTPMRLVDHLYFIAEHDDHHLARIWELRNLRG
jgi:uncharacterized damage-inducible protein DinB